MSAGRAPTLAARAPGSPRSRAAGQGIVEFGVILAVAVVVAIVVLVLFRPQLAVVLSLIGSEVEKSSWLPAALACLG